MFMTDSETKLVIGGASVGLGWLLAQGTVVAKERLRRLALKKALFEELGLVDERVRGVLLHYSQQIKIAAIGGIHPESMVAIETPIYKAYFAEAYLALTPAQRSSYIATHAQIAQINEGFEQVRKFLRDLKAQETGNSTTLAKGAAWMDLLKAEYLNAARAQSHLQFHLKNPNNPDLGDPYGPIAQSFGKRDHQAADSIGELIAQAEGKTLAELRVHMADRHI